MAITAAQRTLGIQVICRAAIQGNLAQYLPGVTAAQVWSTLTTAIGTNFDAQLTTALGNAVTAASGAVAADNTQLTADQALVTSYTVV